MRPDAIQIGERHDSSLGSRHVVGAAGSSSGREQKRDDAFTSTGMGNRRKCKLYAIPYWDCRNFRLWLVLGENVVDLGEGCRKGQRSARAVSDVDDQRFYLWSSR